MKRKTFIKKLAKLIASTVTGRPDDYDIEAATPYAEGIADLLVVFDMVEFDEEPVK